MSGHIYPVEGSIGCSVLVLRHEYSFHDALKETKDQTSDLGQ